jgi:hypothetical protein
MLFDTSETPAAGTGGPGGAPGGGPGADDVVDAEVVDDDKK